MPEGTSNPGTSLRSALEILRPLDDSLGQSKGLAWSVHGRYLTPETSESPEYNLEEAKIQMQPHQLGQAL